MVTYNKQRRLHHFSSEEFKPVSFGSEGSTLALKLTGGQARKGKIEHVISPLPYGRYRTEERKTVGYIKTTHEGV